MKGEFPCAFLYLEIDPEEFDVNIHPQKREVLFYDEKMLRTALNEAIKHCLQTSDLVPHLTPSSVKKKQSQLNLPKSDIRSPRTLIKDPQVRLKAKSFPSELRFTDQAVLHKKSSDIELKLIPWI